MSNPSDPNNRSGDSSNPPPSQAPQPPGYGYPPAPGYSAPPPGYGPVQGPPSSEPGYGTPPGYGGPSSPGIPTYATPPGYGPPQPGASGYGGPPAGYQGGAPGFGYPPPGYGPRPPYASWIQRVGGALVDALIVGVPAAILYIIGFTVGLSAQTCAPDENGYPVCTGGGLSGAGWVLVVVAWLFAVAGGLYLTYLVGTTGQTPGKRMVGIRLVREADGQVLGFGMAFVRNLCHILDSFCYIGYLWPIWDEKRQTFADKIMKSIVVQA